MIRLEMKKEKLALIETLQKYHYYHQVKLINMNILRAKILHIIYYEYLTYSTLGKPFGNKIKTIQAKGEKQKKILEKHGKQLVKSKAFFLKRKTKYTT